MINLHALLELYNTYSHDDIYFDISKSILENYKTLNLDSISDFSECIHVSNSSISRFLKQLYYENFTVFKAEHLKSEEFYQYDYNYIPQNEHSNMLELKDFAQLITMNIEKMFNAISKEVFTELYDRFKKSEKIVFTGMPISSDIWRLQIELILLGKKTSAFIDPNYQLEAVQSVDEKSLVVCIDTIRQDDNFLQEIIDISKQNNAFVSCISHIRKKSYEEKADNYIYFDGTNSYIDNYALNLILNFIGQNLRNEILNG